MFVKSVVDLMVIVVAQLYGGAVRDLHGPLSFSTEVVTALLHGREKVVVHCRTSLDGATCAKAGSMSLVVALCYNSNSNHEVSLSTWVLHCVVDWFTNRNGCVTFGDEP